MDEKESIESKNERAEKMYKEGGVWQVETYNGKLIDVEIIDIWTTYFGIRVLEIRALKGKPWQEKEKIGRRTIRRATNICSIRPESLFRKANHDTCEN